MIDITTIISEISSSLQHFDFVFGIYQTSLDSLFQYANNNIASFNITGNYPDCTMTVIPSDPAQDPIGIANFYKKEYNSVIALRETLESDIDQAGDKLDLLENNSHNYDQEVRNTIAGLKSANIQNYHRYNNSIGYHRTVMRNKRV